jgi:protein-S-isoprenylcysteine O-methyltransferase Ste14
MRALELKLPPPVLALLLAILMWWLSSFFAPFHLSFACRLGAALAIAAAGTGIGIAAKLSFRQARTTVNPLTPAAATAFVSSGVYRFTRNPMYLGRSLQLLAWAVYLCNAIAVMPVFFFVLYITGFQIRPEERALLSRFGDPYAAYLQRVRRWA